MGLVSKRVADSKVFLKIHGSWQLFTRGIFGKVVEKVILEFSMGTYLIRVR
jgi:hypothetical protein